MPYLKLWEEMVLEGGAIEIDGKGSLLATKSAIINKNRNRGLTLQDAEDCFNAYLGITHCIWLDGVTGQDITDCHIDGFARFQGENTIVTMSKKDLEYWQLSKKDIKILLDANNRIGLPYQYVFLPLTKHDVITSYGKKLNIRGSYINYYIANNLVLVPVYNDPNDIVAVEIIKGLYPKS